MDGDCSRVKSVERGVHLHREKASRSLCYCYMISLSQSIGQRQIKEESERVTLVSGRKDKDLRTLYIYPTFIFFTQFKRFSLGNLTLSISLSLSSCVFLPFCIFLSFNSSTHQCRPYMHALWSLLTLIVKLYSTPSPIDKFWWPYISMLNLYSHCLDTPFE